MTKKHHHVLFRQPAARQTRLYQYGAMKRPLLGGFQTYQTWQWKTTQQ